MNAEYLRQKTDEELAQMLNNMSMSFPYAVSYLECIELRSWFTELAKRLTSKAPAPQWLRHEGGTMPEGVGDQLVVCRYDDYAHTGFGAGCDRDWDQRLWYFVIPAPPEPPQKWTVTTKGDSTILRKNGNHVCGLGCFTPAEQTAIVDALNKVQGGGE